MAKGDFDLSKDEDEFEEEYSQRKNDRIEESKAKKRLKPKFIRTVKPRIDKDFQTIMNQVAARLHLTMLV